MVVSRADSTDSHLPHSISAMYTWVQRLRSCRHRLWFGVGERVRWSRGAYRETPADTLPDVPREQAESIAALRGAYQVEFERQMTAATALKNYEYLDVLSQLWRAGGLAARRGGKLHDVGCASFWYAAALDAFFAPSEMVGVDVEGYRLFKDGRTRIDYAAGYLRDLPRARFEIVDYADFDAAADVITAWFPFVSPQAILAWRLPLSLLAPAKLFARINHNLTRGGYFIMINHGVEEAELAAHFCLAAGLKAIARQTSCGPLGAYRLQPAVASCWVAA